MEFSHFHFVIADMQEEEEAEDGERFERYTPQFPLPNDISNMSRKDTVCKFCGVSYLIHNEIKALEAKCKKLESDLAFFAGIDSREAALEKTLENERAKISDLQSTISINQHKYARFFDSLKSIKFSSRSL